MNLKGFYYKFTSEGRAHKKGGKNCEDELKF